MSVEADRGETYDGNEKGRSFLISLSCGVRCLLDSCVHFESLLKVHPGLHVESCTDARDQEESLFTAHSASLEFVGNLAAGNPGLDRGLNQIVEVFNVGFHNV